MPTSLADIESQKTLIATLNKRKTDLTTTIIPNLQRYIGYCDAGIAWYRANIWTYSQQGGQLCAGKSGSAWDACTQRTPYPMYGDLQSAGVSGPNEAGNLYPTIEQRKGQLQTDLANANKELATLTGTGPGSVAEANATLTTMQNNYQHEATTTAYLNMTPAERLAADKAAADAKIAAQKAVDDAKLKKYIVVSVIIIVIGVTALLVWKKVL